MLQGHKALSGDPPLPAVAVAARVYDGDPPNGGREGNGPPLLPGVVGLDGKGRGVDPLNGKPDPRVDFAPVANTCPSAGPA